MLPSLLLLGALAGPAHAACPAEAEALGRSVKAALGALSSGGTGAVPRFQGQATAALQMAGCLADPPSVELDQQLHLLWAAWLADSLLAGRESTALVDLFLAFDAMEARGMGEADMARLVPEGDYLRVAHGLWRAWREDHPAPSPTVEATLPWFSGCTWWVDGELRATLPDGEGPALVQLLCSGESPRSAWRVRPGLLPPEALPARGPGALPSAMEAPVAVREKGRWDRPWVTVSITGGLGMTMLTAAGLLRADYLSGDGDDATLVGWNAATGMLGIGLLGSSVALAIPWGGHHKR